MRVIRRDKDDDQPAANATTQPPQNTQAEAPAQTKPPQDKPQASSGSEEEPDDALDPGFIEPLTPQQRQQRSVANMTLIAQALTTYATQRRHFPTLGTKNADEDTVLSWQVELLPYLGHLELYKKFKRTRSWNSPENEPLLKEIPDVYRIPGGRPNEFLTPYKVIWGETTCFTGTNKPTMVRNIVDGLENTIILVEVGDDFAIPWTSPGGIKQSQLLNVVGDHYDGRFLAMWADGRVGMIPLNVDQLSLQSACTIRGQDKADLWQLAQPMAGALIKVKPKSVEGVELGSEDENEDPLPPELTGINGGSVGSSASPSTPNPVPQQRAPVPSDTAQREAIGMVKELFLVKYQEADNAKDKQAVAKDMLTKSSQISSDLPGKYVMLTTAQKIALETGDVDTARSALDALVQTFQFDPYAMKVALLKKTSTSKEKESFDTRLMDEARQMMEEAVKRDDFPTAKDMLDVALTTARRLVDKKATPELTKRGRQIDKLAASYVKLKAVLATVGDAAEDEKVSEQVGRYYCLMKGDWKQGLPHLARGANANLRRLAQRDLESPTDAARQLELADGWWNESTTANAPEDEQLRQRAAWWYENANKNLPQGLAKLKAELRIKEAKGDKARLASNDEE
jgi:hypothetical protein